MVVGNSWLFSEAWHPTGKLQSGRRGYSSAVLTDGRVLIWMGAAEQVFTYEIFDPAVGEWRLGNIPSSVKYTINHPLSVLLPNGKVLCCGGYLGMGEFYIYDPVSSTHEELNFSLSWNETERLGTLLKDGRVWLGWEGNRNYFFHYQTQQLTEISSSMYSSHVTGSEVLLPDGRVLVMGGGSFYGSGSRNCEIFNPWSGSWEEVRPMQVKRARFGAVLLREPQRVLVVGGTDTFDNVVAGFRECEIYSPTFDVWISTERLQEGRLIPGIVLLPNGEVLVGGGETEMGIFSTYLSSCEIFNPNTQTWRYTTSLNVARSHMSFILLHTGKVLAVGGYTNQFTKDSRCEIYTPFKPLTISTTPLGVGRKFHTSTPLPIISTRNCSTNILVVGGEDLTGKELKSCELYNYTEETVLFTSQMKTPRSLHTATLLPDGRVLVVGGKSNGQAISSCEIYDPKTESWSEAPSLQERRYSHTATLLADGRVLVTGGIRDGVPLSSCEIFDGNNWSIISSMNSPRSAHTANLLLEGKVLVIGGRNSNGVLSSCEVYDSQNGTWRNVGNLREGRCYHTSVTLQSGEVLIIGGEGGSGVLTSVEAYVGGRFEVRRRLNKGRRYHNSLLLYSGLVVTVGGEGSNGDAVREIEIYDPAIKIWEENGRLVGGRVAATATLVGGEKPYVVVIGGSRGGSLRREIEKYDIGLGYLSAWQNKITNYKSITKLSSTMRIEGKLFRDITEADGGNYCHITNTDHPIITLVRIGGGNFQGNGGDEVIYIPYSTSWNETHTEVQLQPLNPHSGYYRMWAIVNAIPTKWYKECPYGIEEEVVVMEQRKIITPPVIQKVGRGVLLVKEELKGGNLVLYDCMGRVVKQGKIVTTQLKVNSLTQGIYFYKIIVGNKEFKGKVVVFK